MMRFSERNLGMRSTLWWAAVLLIGAGSALGQEDPRPEQLRTLYEDALVQLRLSQDRKNELASENEELQKQIAKLETELTELSHQLLDARRELDGQAEKTFFLRSHYAAWHVFMQRHPGLLARWRMFLEADPLAVPNEPVEFYDPHWPLSMQG
jgi:hypothetical protein